MKKRRLASAEEAHEVIERNKIIGNLTPTCLDATVNARLEQGLQTVGEPRYDVEEDYNERGFDRDDDDMDGGYSEASEERRGGGIEIIKPTFFRQREQGKVKQVDARQSRAERGTKAKRAGAAYIYTCFQCHHNSSRQLKLT